MHLTHKLSDETKKNLSLKSSGENNGMYNKHHSSDTIEKMKKAKSKENNPSFGTCWIYNLDLKECKKILKTELHLYEGWILGRKMKFE